MEKTEGVYIPTLEEFLKENEKEGAASIEVAVVMANGEPLLAIVLNRKEGKSVFVLLDKKDRAHQAVLRFLSLLAVALIKQKEGPLPGYA